MKGERNFERRLFVNELYDNYKSLLTEKQCAVYEMHEISDLSLSEIAEQTGVSRQAIYDVLCRTQAKLEQLEQKLGLTNGSGEDV